ncbi:MAG: trypsin-like peptidase domain-containing protein [Planctomycetota bacterium]
MRRSALILPLALALATPALADRFVLREDRVIEGNIVKETDDNYYIDVGFSVIEVPKKAVIRREKEKSPEAADAAGAETLRDDVYFTTNLATAPIKKHVERFGQGVVLVSTPSGLGSGFIIHDKEGYVVTNYHVVEQEQNISVTIFVKRGRELEHIKKEKIRIVALNPFLDLALLKIEDIGDTPLVKVFLGDSDAVKTGDPVFAIGNPLGLERTVSEGIISTKRQWQSEGTIYLQTTTPINPGNSGGPLFNERGEVVGVTNMKIFAEGLCFAIPANIVKEIFLKNREFFVYDNDNPNTGYRYLAPPSKRKK